MPLSKGVILKQTVGVNEFVKRQVKGTGKTYTNLTFEDIAKYSENKLNRQEYTEGYRPGVVIIKVDQEMIAKFICPFVKIDENTNLKAEVVSRRNNEENYIRIKATNGKTLKTNSVDLILYRRDVLEENNEQTTNSKWELISFHAVPQGVEKMPMGPVTMMRNQLELPGGTKGVYKSEEWADSVKFWQNYAIKD